MHPMTKQEIQNLTEKLNHEYKTVGEIVIKEADRRDINIKDIKCSSSILSSIELLASDEPIVVAKPYRFSEEYIIIDGHHRFKYLKETKEVINVIYLLSYNIKHSADDLLSFLEQNVGSDICFLSNKLLSINKFLCEIEPNEGCGGCSNGWSSFELVDGVVGKNMKIQSVEARNEEYDVYDLFINDVHIARVDTGYGNGYYGGDFNINVIF